MRYIEVHCDDSCVDDGSSVGCDDSCVEDGRGGGGEVFGDAGGSSGSGKFVIVISVIKSLLSFSLEKENSGDPDDGERNCSVSSCVGNNDVNVVDVGGAKVSVTVVLLLFVVCLLLMKRS